MQKARKRNIVVDDDMWSNLNRISGRIAMKTGQRCTVSDVIRMACQALIEIELKHFEEENNK